MNNILNLHRRDLLGVASAAGLLALIDSPVFGASDFWNRKQPADWSVAEVEQLKTKSPWARKVRGEMALAAPTAGAGGGGRGSRGGGGGGGMGGGDATSEDMGGGGGGRGGGRGESDGLGAPGGRAGVQGPEVVIRWESAKPLLDATKLKLPPAMDNHYALGVTGLPPEMLAAFVQGRGGGRGRRGRDGQAVASAQPADEQPGNEQPGNDKPQDAAAREKAIIDRILAGATLSAKGKDPASADHLMQTIDKQTLIFGFAKDSLLLSAEDKEVVFTLKLLAIFKAKFQLKEMMYGGQLAV